MVKEGCAGLLVMRGLASGWWSVGGGVSFLCTTQQGGFMENLVTQNVMHASLCHVTNGTFQGGYSAMFTASMRVLFRARRVL